MTAATPNRGDAPAVFVVKFVPLPGRGWPDVNARRKRLLKLASRACGLKCVGLDEEPHDRSVGPGRSHRPPPDARPP